MFYRIALAVLFLLGVAVAPASARHLQRHQHHQQRVVLAPAQDNLFSLFNTDIASYGRASPGRTRVASSRERGGTPARYRVKSVRSVPERSQIGNEQPVVSHEAQARPGDCYGIPWCGCFMRHYKGVADRSLNLARNWAGVGSATSPHSGAIVVWRGHVGELRSEPDAHGRALVFSGNNGSGNVATVRLQYVGNAIAFRQI